ncbi:MAG: inverse autotransporter beta domain-containing protein, partial [Desulfovibrio sp.]|nr:inverse autotransporter beta domain-containing protein [Desulfovibrio sp.]
MTETLFNYAAGFAGVPGLAPRRGVDGSLDEGLGFHQDGTARRAGGTAGTSGPSDRGQRAGTYMQSGLNGAGFGPGFNQYRDLYDGMLHDLWGRDDPTRGGRLTGQNGYSREPGDFDPFNMAIDRGLNWGAGFLNSMGEAGISSLVDGGRARLNFTIDGDGHFQGEGDALLPFYDSQYTTIFTQIGARSMAVSGGEDDGHDRWIGNFGLGQRWFPHATEEDSGDWMLGYNAFLDNDFTRSHQRGGLGLEAQYDWLRVASNYYFPLSGWKGSYDFDSRFIEERPAEGWDARVKAYLPFYRNVALSGAYTQWFGDHVGMFGHRNLEKDPKVWSYGLEYTPVPLASGFINQRRTELGETDTEFGLSFTYHFGMPFEDQIKPSKVAELRTVSGSRHEFVDRENRIILEYRAKNSYRIEYLGPAGKNLFRFRVLDGFDEVMAGQTVLVTASQTCLAPAPEHNAGSYVTDGRGEFLVELDEYALPVDGEVSVTVRAGDNEQTFTLNGSASSLISVTASVGSFTSGYATASLTAKVVDKSGDPLDGYTVTWSVVS